jgi:hypothetical protein
MAIYTLRINKAVLEQFTGNVDGLDVRGVSYSAARNLSLRRCTYMNHLIDGEFHVTIIY